MCIWRVLHYVFIVHGKIYYVRRTTSYHLFSTISDKKIVSIIFTRIIKHIHLRGLYKENIF